MDAAYRPNTLDGGVPLSMRITPEQFELMQNYPNPFNPETTIRYAVANPSYVKLTVHTALGQPVKTLVGESQRAGRYRVNWDGCDEQGRPVASGVYFYRIVAGDFQEVRRMAIVK